MPPGCAHKLVVYKYCRTDGGSPSYPLSSGKIGGSEMESRELYKIAIDTRNMEIGLFWQRSNYFLVLNTAIAVGFFSVDRFIFQVVLSITGVAASVMWFCVNLGSKYWQSRWEHRTSVLESEIGASIGRNIELFSAPKETLDSDVRASLLNNKDRDRLNIYERWVMKKPSVSKSMSCLAALFVVFWAVVLLVLIARPIYAFARQCGCP